MSGCSRRVSALLACAVLCAPLARAQDAVARADELYRASDFRGALEAASAIADPALRAAWEFQILDAAGDLSGALNAALRGIEVDPSHVALLHNAMTCAITLGDARLSSSLCEQWGSAIAASSLDDETRAREVDAHARMSREAARLVELERQASRALLRARVAALAILSLAVIAIGWLSWRTRAPRA